jgi:hypothetical protein
MGAPTSSIFSEIYLQYIENNKIFDVLLKHHVKGYFCYVDDILIVYKEDKTNIYDMVNTVNNIMPRMKLTTEEEKEKRINFLDITTMKDNKNLAFNTNKKTHTITPNDSCHPQEHKLAAIRYLSNRMEIYNPNPKNKEKESNKL